jgi:molybdenum cofactor cytidylyltransferase
MRGLQTFALIPAAGKSTRMGCPKLLLPLENKTVLEHVIAALRQAGIENVLVVAGPNVPELVTIAEKAGALVCPLLQETADMKATVQEGLRWLEKHFQPVLTDAWFLVPADHPTLEAGTIQELLRAYQQKSGCSIFIPTYEGKRGHPALIEWKLVTPILELTGDAGINAYLRRQTKETLEVPVSSPSILHDLDRPEDYAQLWQR